jgi:hypothetical protein
MNLPHHLLQHPPAWTLALLLALDGLFFGLTNPTQLASIWLIVAFILLAATVYRLSRVGLTVLGWYGLRVKRPQRLASTLTGIIIALVALQSIGELTMRDILVGVPLIVILYLYLMWGAASASAERR